MGKRTSSAGELAVIGWLAIGLLQCHRAHAQVQIPEADFPVRWLTSTDDWLVCGGTHSIIVCRKTLLRVAHRWKLDDRQIALGVVVSRNDRSADQRADPPAAPGTKPPHAATQRQPPTVVDPPAAGGASTEGQVAHHQAPRDLQIVLVGAWGDEQGFARGCRLTDGQPQWERSDLEHPIISVAAESDQVWLGDDHGMVTCLSATDGRTLWSRPLHAKLVTCLRVLANGWLASADWTGKIVIADGATGELIGDFRQHRDRVSALTSVAGNPVRLYSASRDGSVRLWYPQQYRLVRFVQLPRPVVTILAENDWSVLAATEDGQIHLLDMSRARVRRTFTSGLGYVQAMHRVGEQQLLVSDGVRTLNLIRVPETGDAAGSTSE